MAQLPAGMRNNNPGNIKYIGQAGTHPSVNTDQGDPQAVFASPEAGMRAMYELLLRKYGGGKRTAAAIIAGQGGWTPGNMQAAQNVARTMGVDVNADVNLQDPVQAAKFMRALMLQEHGQASAAYTDAQINAAIGRSPNAGDKAPGVPTPATSTGSAPAGTTLIVPDTGLAASYTLGETLPPTPTSTLTEKPFGETDALMAALGMNSPWGSLAKGLAGSIKGGDGGESGGMQGSDSAAVGMPGFGNAVPSGAAPAIEEPGVLGNLFQLPGIGRAVALNKDRKASRVGQYGF